MGPGLGVLDATAPEAAEDSLVLARAARLGSQGLARNKAGSVGLR